MTANIFSRLQYLRNPFHKFSLSKSKEDLIKMAMTFIMLIYGLLLGLSTLLDWKGNLYEIKKNFFIIMLFRLIFTSLFTLDWTIIFFTLPKFTLSFIVDTIILLIDISSVIQVIIAFNRTGNDSDSVETTLLLSILGLTRLYKLCLINSSLVTLSKSIIVSIKSLVWAAFFLFVVIYSSAIFATWSFNKVENDDMYEFWGTIFKSMFTLFTVLTLEGWNDVATTTAASYPNSKLFFVGFVCFATITIMNVVTGIIFEAYLSISQQLSIEKQWEERNMIKGRLMKLLKGKRSKNGKKFLTVPYGSKMHGKGVKFDKSPNKSMGKMDEVHNIKINITPAESHDLDCKIVTDDSSHSFNYLINSQLSGLSNSSAISACSENISIPQDDPKQALILPAISRIIQVIGI